MKQYEVTAAFWRNGNLVDEGSQLTLSDAEAKYLGHAVVEVKPEVVAEPEAVAAEEGEPKDEAAGELGVEVIEHKSSKRRR